MSLHPAKTRLIEFGRFAATDRKLRGLGKPETFTFLGFTFICGLSRRGNFQLQRKTRRDRMLGKLKDIKAELPRFCCRLATDATMRTHQFNLGFQLTATTNALLWAFRSSRPRWKSSASLRVFE